MALSRLVISGVCRLLLVAGIVVLLTGPRFAHAVPPKYFIVSDTRIETLGGHVAAKCSINVDNVDGLFEMLKDGATVELVVQAKLERVRSLWTNISLAELELVSTLQHNPLTREFSLHMPGEQSPLLDKNLNRLLAATWNKFIVVFGPLSLLDREEDSAEFKAILVVSLQHAKPPPWLIKNFMLWSKSIVAPETITLPFHY